MRSLFLLLLLLPIALFANDSLFVRPAETSGATLMKNRGYVGLTFAVNHSEGENYTALLIIPVEQKDQTDWRVNVLGGYMIKKYFSVGGGISYQYSHLEAAVSDTTTNRAVQSKVSITPHIRNYLPWTEKLFFQIYNQTNLGFSFGSGVEESDNGSSIDRTYIKDFGFNIGIQPGVAVFIAKGVTVETSVNLLGFDMNRKTIEVNGVETGYLNDAGVNFNLNLMSLNLGITVYL